MHPKQTIETYEARRQARITRLRQQAAKHQAAGDARLTQAREMGSMIPLGQPILVGHHSERSDRSIRAKISRNYEKGFEHHRIAEDYRTRAAAAEANTAISSDDPDAIPKIEAKIAHLETRQEQMKAANKIIKSRKKDYTADQRIADLQTEIGLTEETARTLLDPARFGGAGFPGFELTNNNANIRRLKARLGELRRAATETTTERMIGDVRIVDSTEENRLQVYFPGKPDETIRSALKGHGFRWSPRNGCWQAYRSAQAERIIETILQEAPGP